MSAIFILKKKRAAKKRKKCFLFLKDRYFVLASPIDMNVDLF